MLYEPQIQDLPPTSDATTAPASPHFPAGLVLLERATAARGLDHYIIFHFRELDLNDLDHFLPKLDPSAAWQSLPLLADGDQPQSLEIADDQPRIQGVGLLHLPRFNFLCARWNWISTRYNFRQTTILSAAPDPSAYTRLHRALLDLRRDKRQPVWEIIRGSEDYDTQPRKPARWEDLFLSPPLVARLRDEIVSFFTQPVIDMYRAMNVPHRRGVLMHGPPGNGKTSVIRAIGAALPDCVAMILRPTQPLDDDDLKSIFRRWRKHAPALLIIEDLDHLLKDYINLSHFLNHLDGIDQTLTGGLLLLATTNHPEKLDPAINNRPGRFDVVIELPCPDPNLRQQFFQAHLAGVADETIEQLNRQSANLSFAHLHEIIRLAGLLAIHEQSPIRTADHLTTAARLVAESHQAARNGFPIAPEAPFGLAQFRRNRE